MAQEDKEYFVGVQYTWGKQGGVDETVGGCKWGYLTYDQSVAVNAIVAEAMKKLLDDAVSLGMEMVGDQELVGKLKANLAAK
jgi:hypothetical protein